MRNMVLLTHLLAIVNFSSYAAKSELVFPGLGSQRSDVRLTLIKGDITKQHDAHFIVNAANSRLLGGGGVDGAIHAAAGPALKKWIKENIQEINLGVRLNTGQAVRTPSFDLIKQGVANIIHTVGPDCRTKEQNNNRKQLLAMTYQNCLESANFMAKVINHGLKINLPEINWLYNKKVKTIAFPSISTAIYAYPIKEAALIAIETIGSVIKQGNFALQEVRFVLFSDADLAVYQEALQEYISTQKL